MSRSCRWLGVFAGGVVLLGLPGSCLAGMITLGGSLLSQSVATPMLLAGDQTVDAPFMASMPDVGVIRGTVQVGNSGATAGVIRLIDFQFQSLRPAGAGDVSFTLAVDQDFVYAGPARVNSAFALSGVATFTASPQSASGQVAGFFGVVLDPLPFSASANPQAAFPQVQDFGTTGSLQGLPAGQTMTLELSLALRLSDNAVGSGPRFDSPGGSGPFVSIGYAAPVAEPATAALLGVSALALLGYAWRRAGNFTHLFPAAGAP
ncbi:MAG TPA: hypothetical protein VKU02_08165 [Gemmataceae bacterium]|nr:hypothetical protein [Gemmataceae bacterium]